MRCLPAGPSNRHSRRFAAATPVVVAAAVALLAAGIARGSAAAGRDTSVAQALPASTTAPALFGTAREGSRLAASKGDWSGSPTGYAYQWQRCNPGCTAISGALGQTYVLGSGDVGATVKVTVTATNGTGSASADSPGSATIAAAPAGAPRNSDAPAISGSERQGKALSASTGSWSGSGNTYAYTWLRCGPSGGGCSALSGATKASYILTKDDVGATLRVDVTATNASGSNSAFSIASDQVAVGNAPVNRSQPSISGTPMDNHEVEAEPGTWSGDGPISFRYQWQRCNPQGRDCKALDGFTGKRYEVRSSDQDHTLRVLVTATNGVGSATAQSDPVTVRSRSKPVGRTRPSISGNPVVGQVLTADHGSWSGTGSIDFRYSWLRCNSAGQGCSTISAASGSTYTLTAADAGHRIRVVVLARNSVGKADWTSGSTALVQASGPVNTSAPTAAGSARQGGTLTARAGGWSSAAPLAFSFQWSRCDAAGNRCAPIPGATHPTYTLTTSDVGHRLVVYVQARSRRGAGYATSRPTAVVTSSAPVSTARPVVTGTARAGGTLAASTGAWSSPTVLSFVYQWARCDPAGRNCAPIGGATQPAYVLTAADVGHRLIVQVKAQNDRGASFATSTPTALVAASAPQVVTPAVIPAQDVSLPDRLVIDRIRFEPARIRSSRAPLVARFHVTEMRSGKPVSGALVRAVAVPFNRLSAEREVQTDGSGWATVVFDVRATWPLKPGYLVVILVRARKPGGSILAGVSTRRFASVRAG